MGEAVYMSEASQLAHFMGLRGWSEIDDVKLVKRVAKGLPLSTAKAIAKRIDPSGDFLEVYTLIPKSTYFRHRDLRKPLNKNQSEMIFALSKVFSEAIRQYHDDRESALLFLTRKHPLLDMRSPLDVARESTAGADLVMKMLARADAGVAV